MSPQKHRRGLILLRGLLQSSTHELSTITEVRFQIRYPLLCQAWAEGISSFLNGHFYLYQGIQSQPMHGHLLPEKLQKQHGTSRSCRTEYNTTHSFHLPWQIEWSIPYAGTLPQTLLAPSTTSNKNEG